jgi:hypothetical protein
LGIRQPAARVTETLPVPNDAVLDMPASTTAVLHGMMTTLSEVLGGIDGRIAALERQLREARADSGSPRALAQTVEAAVARLTERMEAIEAVVTRPVRDEALHGAVDALRQSIDALAVRPVRDDELHAAVAALAARPAADAELRAAVADLAARPAVDEQLRGMVAELAARPMPVDEQVRAAVGELRTAVAELAARPAPVDPELRGMVAELASRPAPVDEELRASVGELRSTLVELGSTLAELAARPVPVDEELREAVAELVIRPPHIDTELREAVAELTELAKRPAPVDQEVREAVAALAARPPFVDADIHAAVARLAELVAQPPAPDNPVRVGIASLHERLNVVLDVIAQPPKPDDAVRLGLTELNERLAQIHALAAAAAEPPPPPLPPPDPKPDPAVLEVAERLRQLAGKIDALPTEMPEPVSPIDPALIESLGQIRSALADHPAAHLAESMARMEQQVSAFVAQPGPGPAVAMVAAGLAERFEARTDALLDLLNAVHTSLAAAPAALADLAHADQRIEAAVVALRQAVEQPSADPAIERIQSVVEGQQGDIAAVRDSLRGLVDAVERHGAVSGQVAELLLENRAALAREIDRLQSAVSNQTGDVAERLQAVVDTAALMSREVDARLSERLDATAGQVEQSVAASLDSVRRDVEALAATGQDPALLNALGERIAESVRRESELLTQRVAALSLAVDELRTMVANSPGRKAGEVGRKLAADLGIRTKKESPKGRSLGPGSGS